MGLKERVASLATRSIKKDSKLQALNYIISMCDLTTLEGEDTEGKIGQMTAKAIRPDPSNDEVPSVAAVCVYPALVSKAKEMTRNSDVKVASVSSYFPSGQAPLESKILDTQFAIDQGADEIDIVINNAGASIIEKCMMKFACEHIELNRQSENNIRSRGT